MAGNRHNAAQTAFYTFATVLKSPPVNPHLARLCGLARQPGRRIIGLMSGTSLDGLDVALCHCAGHGATLRTTLEHFATLPYSADFRQRLRAISQPTVALQDVTILNAEVARQHAEMVLVCLESWQVAAAEIDSAPGAT